MKLKRYLLASAACIGVVLAHGARADTVIDFSAFPPGQGHNANILQSFGDSALASSEGITVNGFGTPNLDLTWQGVGGAWQYYINNVWTAGQLDSSGAGDQHNVLFVPNNPGAAAVIKSFNFHPYYFSTERYTYDWAVLNGQTVVASGNLTFLADATKDHPVDVNYEGPAGATLTLRLTRVASVLQEGEIEGDSQNIAVDDIVFAQVPEMLLTSAPVVVLVTPSADQTGFRPDYFYQATIADGALVPVPGSVQLALDGQAVGPPSVTKDGIITTVAFQQAALLEAGSTHSWRLTFQDNGVPPGSHTNEVQYTVAEYVNKTLPDPIVFEDFDSTPEGSLPAGWTVMSFADVDILSEPAINFNNLDSAAYTNWTVVEASRFEGTFETYSQLFRGLEQPPGEASDYQRVVSLNPLNVVNGVFLPQLATGRLALGNSGYRLGVQGQIMYLFSPDFDLTGQSDVYLAFHSVWEQNQDSLASVEYSIDQGATWLPALYMLETADVITNLDGTIDALSTFNTSYVDVAVFEGDGDGLGEYGPLIGVAQGEWGNLGPFISPRAQDDPIDSKRVECLRLTQADDQPTVRLRFAHAGVDSWYFGIDNLGLYSIPSVPVISGIVRDGANVVISWPGQPNVKLQMTSSLTKPISWNDVDGSAGASQATVPITGTGTYFALVTF